MPANDPPARSIRSFVRRGGRLTPSQKHALEAYWPLYGLEFEHAMPQLPDGFDALKLEIGIGNGDALIHMASADPGSLISGSKCTIRVSGVASTISSNRS